MGVRAFRARIRCDREALESLWRTHVVYNDTVRSLVGEMFAMLRGERGANKRHADDLSKWMEFVLSRTAKDAVYLMNAVSIKDWKPATAEKMLSGKLPVDPVSRAAEERRRKDLAALIKRLVKDSAAGRLAYDKHDERAGLPDSVFQPATRDAAACLSSHRELMALWHSEHDAWLEQKKKWESEPENKKYLAVRPLFEKFEESVGGAVTKRRGRWHLYLDWLAASPKLAAWRGGVAKVNKLDAAAKRRIEKARPRRRLAVGFKEFWAINPELEALDKLHGYYDREFVRQRKRKRNPDGFDHPPTFTQPDAVIHPRWTLFNGPKTAPYGFLRLQLPTKAGGAGEVDIRLLTGEPVEGEYPANTVTLSLQPDKRLSQFIIKRETRIRTRGASKGTAVPADKYYFCDEHFGGRQRPADIGGAKLVFKNIRLDEDGGLISATPFLIFTVTIEDEPISDKAKKITWQETGGTTKSGKRAGKRSLPKGLVSCAVDLGIRHLGFSTIVESGITSKKATHRGVRVVRSRNLWMEGGPTLRSISNHKREIKNLRRKRGKPIPGERSHVSLQQHIDNMSTDRFKKAAREIVNFALGTDGGHARSDIIILEQLRGFIPDAERERGINAALVNWNRGQLVERIKEVAADAGFKNRVYEVYPYGTSQCCSRCGEVGRRYSIVRDDSGRPVIRFGQVEKLFACPACDYDANADHNASVNLHHAFVDGDAMGAYRAFRDLSDADRKSRVAEIEAELLPTLQRRHRLPLDTPF